MSLSISSIYDLTPLSQEHSRKLSQLLFLFLVPEQFTLSASGVGPQLIVLSSEESVPLLFVPHFTISTYLVEDCLPPHIR